MTALLSNYPLRKTADARSAQVDALRRFLIGEEFDFPFTSKQKTANVNTGKPIKSLKFVDVYDTWANFADRAMSAGGKLPVAAVLPDRPVYEDSALTPREIEDTWSGGDPTELLANGRQRFPLGDASGDGYCLFTHSELVVPIVLLLRAKTSGQRKAMVSRLEDLFIEDGGQLPDITSLNTNIDVPDASTSPVRYGRVLEMPLYFRRKVRFTLVSQQLLDSESTSAENRWLAQFELIGHSQVCVIRRVHAMNPRIELVVDGELDSRGDEAEAP